MGAFAKIAQTRRTAHAAAAIAGFPVANAETYQPTAAFFAQLRQYLGWTREQAAAHLKTFPAVIAALETGALSDLPSWPQTQQIVRNYASLAGIDPSPALHSLKHHVLPAVPAVPTAEPNPKPLTRTFAFRDIFFSWMPRRWPVWRIAIVGVVLIVAGLGTQSTTLEAAMTNLPAPINGVVRYTKEALLAKPSRTLEGMIWIDVDNPRSRRADKLPMKRR